jgi:casein kinase 1
MLDDIHSNSKRCPGVNLLTGQIVAIKFEPRKTDAPQLKDECRSYRVLAGLGKLS